MMSKNKIFYKYVYSTVVHQIAFFGNEISVEEILSYLSPSRTKKEAMKSNSTLQVVLENEVLEIGQVVVKNSTILIRRVPLLDSKLIKSKSNSKNNQVYIPPPPKEETSRYDSSMLPNGYSVMRKIESDGRFSSNVYYNDKNSEGVKEFPSCFTCKLCQNLYQRPHTMPCCGESFCYSCLYFLDKRSIVTCPCCKTDVLMGDTYANNDLTPALNHFLVNNCKKPAVKARRNNGGRMSGRYGKRKNIYVEKENMNNFISGRVYNNQSISNKKSRRFLSDSDSQLFRRYRSGNKRKRYNHHQYREDFQISFDPITLEPKKKKRKF